MLDASKWQNCVKALVSFKPDLFFKLISVRFFRLGFFWCVLLIIILGVVQQGNAQNYQLHTVYMYSFMKYIQWPELPKDAFTIAVLGSDSEIIPHLESMAATKQMNGKPIIIRIIEETGDLGSCEMLFVSKDLSSQPEIISSWESLAREKHFLLLTDSAEITGLSHVNFIEQDNRLLFELNRKRIESAGLRVSTELLALAKIVE